MSDSINRQQAIDALKICDANYDGTNCGKCPLRDDRWNGAWWDDETDCHTKLMRDTAKLLETLSAQPDIIYCKDCKWYGRADKRRFYRGMDCLQKRIDTIVPDRDFCSKAERREQDG